VGYRKKPKLIELRFPGDPEYDGLEVTLRGQSLGGFLELMGIGDVDKSALADQLERFADNLISWNLEDEDGTPVPTTREVVYAQDQDFMLRLATDWVEALQGGVPAPLEPSSTDGELSAVASIPMEPLSPPQPPTAVPA
jgi:hypothetical protein